MNGIREIDYGKVTDIVMYLTVVALFCFLCGLLSSVISDDSDAFEPNEEFIIGNITYVIKYAPDNTLTEVCVYKVIGDVSELIIPEFVNYRGYQFRVTDFNSALMGSTSITSITFSEGLRLISSCALKGCTSLVSLTIPKSVERIGANAFEGCTSLTSLTILGSPKLSREIIKDCTSLTTLVICEIPAEQYFNAFDGCSSVKDLTIPIDIDIYQRSQKVFADLKNVEKITFLKGANGKGPDYSKGDIKDSPWYRSSDTLTTVVIEDGVEYICPRMFFDCCNISDLTLPITLNTTTSNEYPSFVDSVNIKKITFTKGTDGYGFNYGIDDDDSITNYYGFTPWNLSRGSLTEVVFEEGITHIGRYMFNKCDSILSVSFPSTLKDIDALAFCECSSLKSMTLPEGIECIGDSSFMGCRSLTSLTVPGSVKYIGKCAFFHCTALETIVLPDNVEHIGQHAFDGCPASKTMDIPYSVESISGSAFSMVIRNYLI